MYRSALEVGCGSGFIGHYIGQKMTENTEDSKDIPEITLVDINEDAKRFYDNMTEKHSLPYQSEIHIQDARELLEQ